jgi:tetratricopeptide (TPR) repeat protein
MFRFLRKSASSNESAKDRLDSWKEIAAYLRRDVRTLHRWEEDEGLPVHRHLHKSAPSVYAYRSELDEWWNKRQAPGFGQPQSKLWKLGLPVLIGIAGMMLVMSGWWIWHQAPDFVPFEERDWLLVGDIENRTGSELFDETLKYALEWNLSNSRYVNVVPRERIEDIFRLMKKPSHHALTVSVAREVCLRDGEIGVFLSGKAEQLGSSYVLTLQIVEPKEGTTLAGTSLTAEGEVEVMAAVQRLSNWVREVLGESPASIYDDEQRLERVTTPSLKALQLFSKADSLEREGRHAVASELLKRALAEDPEFAAASTWLAWATRNMGAEPAEYLPYAKDAVSQSEHVSEREQLIIKGSYHSLANELETALPLWEALVQRYPKDFWGNRNLLGCYLRLDRRVDAARQQVRLAELLPNDYFFTARAAQELVHTLGETRKAGPWVQRALSLASPEIIRESSPWVLSWLKMYAAFECWREGDVTGALEHCETVARELESHPDEARSKMALDLGTLYFFLGRNEAARKILLDVRPCWDQFSEHLDENGAPDRELVECARVAAGAPVSAMILARAGFLRDAERLMSAFEEQDWPDAYLFVLRGELLRAQGSKEEAVSAFDEGLEQFRHRGLGREFFLAAESLATLLEEEGNPQKAAWVLQRASEAKPRLFLVGAGMWLRNGELMANLYRRLGWDDKASEVEQELLSLLKEADVDHPIHRRLNTGQLETALSTKTDSVQ